MSLGPVKLVVLVCEKALERVVQPELLALGARGYTVCEASGRGNRGERDGRWSLSSNVRIEILCEEALAMRLIDMVETRYSANYGLVIYMVDAMASRADKFV